MSISLAIVFPVVLTMVLLVVQASLWWYARQVALTAAREGAEAGRLLNAAPADGTARARTFLDRAGTAISDPQVSAAGSTDTEIRISVTVRAQSLLPGLSGQLITQHVTAPRERFVPQEATP
ncbi:TadE/TadG family type IV pilus assembly protein [Peterkaempfera bronchialis]|uniref:Pilus assembly protein n=1 Tax=Peterkaempfera bronchialis TaxID=2126346 RepID=A0A345SSZ8_9ACTN|nr:TadE/TadG family type IV pilus assembly protein [Peterkaempfera bronchialis]AXI76853.1 pilus assembly protein [Peterkaempfera bronchialis]